MSLSSAWHGHIVDVFDVAGVDGIDTIADGGTYRCAGAFSGGGGSKDRHVEVWKISSHQKRGGGGRKQLGQNEGACRQAAMRSKLVSLDPNKQLGLSGGSCRQAAMRFKLVLLDSSKQLGQSGGRNRAEVGSCDNYGRAEVGTERRHQSCTQLAPTFSRSCMSSDGTVAIAVAVTTGLRPRVAGAIFKVVFGCSSCKGAGRP